MNKNIYLIGMPLSGKSIISNQLCRKLTNYQLIDTDLLYLKKYNNYDMLIQDEYIFRKREEEIYKNLPKENYIISTGGGVCENINNFNYFKGYIIYLFTSPKILNERNIKYHHIMYEKNNVKDLFNKRDEIYYKYANIIINTDNRNIMEIVGEIIEKIKNFNN